MGDRGNVSVITPALRAFAHRLQQTLDARHVFLFGERLSHPSDEDADLEFVIVSPQFTGLRTWERGRSIRDDLYATGTIAPVRLLCITPEELVDLQHRPSFVGSVLPDAIDLLLPAPIAQ